jgi:tetratricopeptide (TPR) repeat protein
LENKISAAAEQFEKSIKLDANYTAGWLALAELELARGNPGLAESRADSVLRSHRGNAAAFMVRAKAQAVRGRMKEAQESYRSVLSLEPANRDAQYGLAAAVAAQGRLAEAEKLFAAGKEAEPSDPRWILAQSTALSNAGKIVEARRLLEQAGKSAPSAEKLYERLAEVQLSMRDGESARATFQRLVEAQPKNLNYQLGLAGSFALAGKPERAIEVYKGLQVSNGDDVRVWLEPAVLLDELGREEAAISNYREALKRQKDHPIALNNLAWRLLKQGKDLQLALEYAQQAKRALPRVPEVDGTLAEAYTRLAMYRNAAAVYEEMLAYIDAKNKPRILKLLEETRRMSTGKARNA